MSCSYHCALLVLVTVNIVTNPVAVGEMPWVRVADDKHGFVLSHADKPFVPWGFNYDHDENGRLLEDYWDNEWRKVEEDFREMKELGANLARIHLQVAKFMTGPETTNQANLERLGRLLALAERTGIYLDITGLACYRKKDVPKWYDRLDEQQRWAVQCRFWEAVARRCAKSPAVFCYDLMNEPVVPGGARKPGDWLGPPFLGSDSGYFVQCISLDQKGRPRPAIARQWCHQLVAAIRKQDRHHLVTVGLVPWSLDRPGLTSGFVPKEIAPELDFMAVHLYPEKGKIKEAMETLSGFAVGKPVIIEEMFPLTCPLPEFERFVDGSKKTASGWIGFYWGKTLEECRNSNTIQDAIMLNWLEFFRKRAGEIQQVAGHDGSEARLKAAASKGRHFLVSLFDPSVDLLPEYQGATVYWLFHDNYLAAKVLKSSHLDLSQRIQKAMRTFGIAESGKIELVFDEAKRPIPFRHPELIEVKRLGEKVVKTEVLTDRELKGWEDYADLLLLASMSLSQTDVATAKKRFNQALAMWDGTGLKDRATVDTGKYAAYKLALAVIAAHRLNEWPSTMNAIVDRLLRQQAERGGWITDYAADGKPVGLANVETTSLAILALDAMKAQPEP